MPRTSNSIAPDIRNLVESFTADLTRVVQRASLEELHTKLQSVLGDATPRGRGPGRPRGTRTGKRGRPGKFSPEQLDQMGATIVGLLKKTPGARSDQLGAAMKMDAKTLRIPLKALIKAKKVKVKGQKRGTKYYAR
jgi:hypothetical protein